MKFTIFAPILLAVLAAAAPLTPSATIQLREIDSETTGNEVVNDFKDYCATDNNHTDDAECKKYLIAVPNFEKDASKPMPTPEIVIPPIAKPMTMPM